MKPGTEGHMLIRMTSFAVKHQLSTAEALCLPALFAKASSETYMSPEQLLDRAEANEKVGNYLAQVARETTGMVMDIIHSMDAQ